jgi:hypothetical protein
MISMRHFIAGLSFADAAPEVLTDIWQISEKVLTPSQVQTLDAR